MGSIGKPLNGANFQILNKKGAVIKKSLLYGELLIDKMHLDNLNINYIQGQDDLKNWKKSLIGNTKDEYSKEGFIDDDNFKDNQKNEKGINNKYRRIKINNLVISHSELNYYKNTKETIEIKNINLRANLNEDYTYLLKGDFKYTDKLIRYDCFVEKNDNSEIEVQTLKAKGNKCPVCWKISEKPCERHG